jgi:hypothetical protein
MSLITKERLQHFTTTFWNKCREKFAKLNENNVFTGNNIFTDLNIIKNNKSESFAGTDQSGFNGRYTGIKNITNTLFEDGYVTKIRIYSDQTSNNRTDVKIFVVRLSDNMVLEELVNGKQLSFTNINGKIYTEFEVNKKFTEEVYFVIGSGGRYMSAGTLLEEYRNNRIHLTSEPQINNKIASATNLNWVVKYEVHGLRSVKDPIGKWSDLKYVKEYPRLNLVDISKLKNNGYYDTGYNPVYHADWSTVTVTLKPNTVYTMLRTDNQTYSKNIAFRKTDGSIGTVERNAMGNNGVYHYKVFDTGNVNNTGVAYVGAEICIPHNNAGSLKCMLVEGDISAYTNGFIPFGKRIQIGSDVTHLFEPHDMSCGIKSNTIEGAIEEVGKRANKVLRPHIIGEIIQVSRPNADDLNIDGATYLYCGSPRRLSLTTYPDLKNALGVPGSDAFFYAPSIGDIYDSSSGRTVRHYICAKYPV